MNLYINHKEMERIRCLSLVYTSWQKELLNYLVPFTTHIFSPKLKLKKRKKKIGIVLHKYECDCAYWRMSWIL